MLINGIEDGDIQLGNVISNPKHLDGDKLKKFDVAISNPGLMRGKWTSLFGGKFTTDPYERFDYGVPGENQVEFVYIFHMLKSLNDHGRMAILTTPSVLFREGSEGIIRKNLIDNNLIDAIVALPPNLMANTAIPYIIIAFKKNRERRDLLMFDLSSTTDHVEKEGVIKKRLRKESVDKVIKSYKAYEGIDKLSRLVGIDEIKSNDYNLNIPRYILSNDPSDETDLNKRCKEINKLELELRKVQKEIDELIKKS